MCNFDHPVTLLQHSVHWKYLRMSMFYKVFKNWILVLFLYAHFIRISEISLMKIQDIKAMRTRNQKLERWLNGKEHLLLIRRTWVQFPESSLGISTLISPDLDQIFSSSLLRPLYSCSLTNTKTWMRTYTENVKWSKCKKN